MYKNLELCKARHATPAVDGAIFDTEINPLDLAGMQETVAEKLEGVEKLDLYVTGLTVALVAVINYCHTNGISCCLWHFDRNSGDYYPQVLE